MTEKAPTTVPIVNLGKTGLKVSRICFGTMSFGNGEKSSHPMFSWTQNKETVLPLVKRAYEAGINFFDTANFYAGGQSETILGECIRELNIPRQNVVIATKFSIPIGSSPNDSGRSRKHIFDAINNSLKRLGMDYVDLYIVHAWSDTETPIEETMRALNDLVVQGKVLYLGTSNMYAWQLIHANAIAEKNGWAKFVSVQNFYNLIFREEEVEMLPAAKKFGIGITPWSPLCMGFLTGSRKKGQTTETDRGQKVDHMMKQLHPNDNDWLVIDRLVEFAAKKNLPPSQIALAWMLTKSEVTSPIFGATKMQHLEDAIAASHLQLTADEIKHLDELYKPHAGPPPFRPANPQ